jgi:sulfur carrier protein
MNVLINSEPVAVPDKCVVEQLFEIMGLPSRSGVAIAVNNQVVSKESWGLVSLQPNDKVLIIQAAKGG